MSDYDVVIAGGSFAGLTLATSLDGRVALVEKGEVGSGQTSACATTLDLIEKLGLQESIEEVHTEGVIHTRTGAVRFPLPYRFASFDYRTFCQLLLRRFRGDLVPAAATGVDGDAVITGSGQRLRAKAVVDASGWRATLASSVAPGYRARGALTYGLEKPCIGFEDSGLHFYFDPGIRGDGYAWSFPAGPVARAGVLSYVAADGVSDSTEAFLEGEGMRGDHSHGGYLTAGLRPAIAGGVFLVGDAAGHCLPLTGEGIRPAVFFAQRLAQLLNSEAAGSSRAETARRYSRAAAGPCPTLSDAPGGAARAFWVAGPAAGALLQGIWAWLLLPVRMPGLLEPGGADHAGSGLRGTGRAEHCPGRSGRGGSLTITVLLFARLREIAGSGRLDLALPAGATAEDAWSELVQRHPGLGDARAIVRCAIDQDYADWQSPLHDGCELAIIPPTAGG